MKITKVTYQKAFIVGPYLQEKLGFEAEINEFLETPTQALWSLKSMAEDFHKESNPHLYQESAPSFHRMEDEPAYGRSGPSPTIQTEKGGPDDPLYLIQNAPSMEVLATFKIIAGADKTLYEAYCKRMKELQ